MSIGKVMGKIDSAIFAFKFASIDRKLVRQVDTGVRKLKNMNSRTVGMYLQSAKDCGHYSKNPLRRIKAYFKSWNVNRKQLIEENNIPGL